MRWYKVELTCSKANANILEEILVAIGAISISMINISKEDIYEPGVGETPLWEHIKISALFEKNISKQYIKSILKSIPYSNLVIKKLDNQNWVENYQKKFRPLTFGEKLIVCPSWHEVNYPENYVIAQIDPGLAFGSGSHETTDLCLNYLANNSLKDLSVMDYGCGSGILAISSLLLGAKQAIAIDNDPQAITATRENAKKNNVIENLLICNPKNLCLEKNDLIIANIFTNSLIDLRDHFLNKLKDNGKLVLSGILASQLDTIIIHYESHINLLSVKQKNIWCLVEFQKN